MRAKPDLLDGGVAGPVGQAAQDAALRHLEAGGHGGDSGQHGGQARHVGLHVAQQLLQLVQDCRREGGNAGALLTAGRLALAHRDHTPQAPGTEGASHLARQAHKAETGLQGEQQVSPGAQGLRMGEPETGLPLGPLPAPQLLGRPAAPAQRCLRKRVPDTAGSSKPRALMELGLGSPRPSNQPGSFPEIRQGAKGLNPGRSAAISLPPGVNIPISQTGSRTLPLKGITSVTEMPCLKPVVRA